MLKWIRSFIKSPLLQKLLKSQLRVNMVSGVVTAVINAGVLAVAYFVYLNFLGYEKYGLWLVLATVLTFAQLGDIGISQAVTKLVAEAFSRGDFEGIKRNVATALAMLCISGIIALVIVLILKNPIINRFNLSDQDKKLVLQLFPYMCILSIYVLIVQALNSTLSGLGRMDLVNYIQSTGRFLSIVIVTILLYSGLGIESLLIGSTISYIFIHITSLIFIWRITGMHFFRLENLDFKQGKRILHFSGALFSGSILNMFITPFNRMMISSYAGVSQIPVYDIAYSASMQIRALLESGLRPLMPAVSQIGANLTKETKNKISQINRRVMKLILLFGIPLYGLLAISSPLLLRIWFRDKFVENLPGAVLIMMLATFITLLGVPAYNTVVGLGKIRVFLAATLISNLGNLVLVILWYILMGNISVFIVGVCMAVSFAVSTVYLISKAER